MLDTENQGQLISFIKLLRPLTRQIPKKYQKRLSKVLFWNAGSKRQALKCFKSMFVDLDYYDYDTNSYNYGSSNNFFNIFREKRRGSSSSSSSSNTDCSDLLVASVMGSALVVWALVARVPAIWRMAQGGPAAVKAAKAVLLKEVFLETLSYALLLLGGSRSSAAGSTGVGGSLFGSNIGDRIDVAVLVAQNMAVIAVAAVHQGYLLRWTCAVVVLLAMMAVALLVGVYLRQIYWRQWPWDSSGLWVAVPLFVLLKLPMVFGSANGGSRKRTRTRTRTRKESRKWANLNIGRKMAH